jgi:hypothetical protein
MSGYSEGDKLALQWVKPKGKELRGSSKEYLLTLHITCKLHGLEQIRIADEY